jgi:galactose-1-phosphate uridylyltransferase
VAKFLNPAKNFEPEFVPLEFRTDPLTKHPSIVGEIRYVKPEKPDLSGVIEKSLNIFCPFCPENIEKVTPKFPPDLFPEGRIYLDEACVFPNAMPYLPYSAIAVFSPKKHFIDLPSFTEGIMTGGFLASQIYLKRISEHDPEAKYCSINWNYMPPSASSLVHPHLQVFAGYSRTPYQQEVLEASHRYWEENGTNFWPDLVVREKELNERYIGTFEHTSWFTRFAPGGGSLDVMAIFEGKDSILNLSTQDFESLSKGLTKIFNYIDDQGLYSFNLSLYSGIIGKDYFWTHARIIPRLYLPPLGTSDVGSLQLSHNQSFCLKLPETACKELRGYFK